MSTNYSSKKSKYKEGKDNKLRAKDVIENVSSTTRKSQKESKVEHQEPVIRHTSKDKSGKKSSKKKLSDDEVSSLKDMPTPPPVVDLSQIPNTDPEAHRELMQKEWAKPCGSESLHSDMESDSSDTDDSSPCECSDCMNDVDMSSDCSCSECAAEESSSCDCSDCAASTEDDSSCSCSAYSYDGTCSFDSDSGEEDATQKVIVASLEEETSKEKASRCKATGSVALTDCEKDKSDEATDKDKSNRHSKPRY